MNRTLFWPIAGLMALSIPSINANANFSPTDTVALSLDQCISIALDSNPTIKVADMEIARVDYSKKETLGQLLPTIAFGGQYNRTLSKQVAYMNMSGLGGGNSNDSNPENETASKASSRTGIKMGLDNSYTVGFTASMPLVAPQLWKSLKLSDTQILQNVEAARSSRLSLINSIENAYYALLLAEDSHKVMVESYENAKFNHDIYTKKHQVGAASEYDVLRTSVALKNIEPEVLQAEIAIKQARLQLVILMGLDNNCAIKATTTLSDYESTMYDQVLAIDRSINNNTDLRMLDLQTQSLNEALEVQKMAWYPTLSLSAAYNWTSSNDGVPFKNLKWNPYSYVALTLNVPLFEGGQRYTRIKQAEIQASEMKWQRENLERSINMQVDLAIDNIKMNIEQISSTSESVKEAVKAHEIMEKSFQIGAASYLDLRDSDLALTRARLAYYQSIYNYLVAGSDLKLLLGNTDTNKYKTQPANNNTTK